MLWRRILPEIASRRSSAASAGCAPQKIDPALIARFRATMLGCFVPVDATKPSASLERGEARSFERFRISGLLFWTPSRRLTAYAVRAAPSAAGRLSSWLSVRQYAIFFIVDHGSKSMVDMILSCFGDGAPAAGLTLGLGLTPCSNPTD